MMGGKITLESVAGKGSTFRFTALLRSCHTLTDQNQISHPNLRDLRVLIVDDNETNRRIIHHQVVSRGMHSGCAEDGCQALEMLRTAAKQGEAYKVAVLDMMMPGMDGLELAVKIKADPSIAGTFLILLTSFGVSGDTKAVYEAGISACLTKPVRQNELYDCLAGALSTKTGSESLKSPECLNSQKGTSMLHGHILIAEDNPVNQEVTQSMLEHLGCTAYLASDGLAAVEAFSADTYDLILMDCQMPIMDGYEATRVIRQREMAAQTALDGKSPNHIPIISLTAYAMDDDREKCLAAGMDDHLSKPFTLDGLSTILKRWLPLKSKVDSCVATDAGDDPVRSRLE